MRQFLYVVHQGIELPLTIDLVPCSVVKPIHPFVMPDVAKGWLYRTQSFAVDRSASRAVDLLFHPGGVGIVMACRFGVDEDHLSRCLLLGVSQAFRPESAVFAGTFGGAEFDRWPTIDLDVDAVSVKPLSRRTGAGQLLGIVVEVLGPELVGPGLGFFVFVGIDKSGVALSE